MLQCSYQLDKKHFFSDVLRKGQSRRIICQLSITTSSMAEDIFPGKHEQSLLKHCSYLRKTTVISTGKLTGKFELFNWTNEKTVQLNQGKTELFNNQGMNTYERPASRKCKQIKWQTPHREASIFNPHSNIPRTNPDPLVEFMFKEITVQITAQHLISTVHTRHPKPLLF